LQQASAVARQAGLTLEQTVGVLTLFARSGLRGSDAGTSFRTAMIRLINPTAKAQKEIDKLGLHLRTATGAINLNVFDEFTKKTQDLTAAQRDQALAIIFGQDAIRGAAILAREGRQGLDDQITALQKQGTAAELAGARMAGFSGSLENLKNQLSAVGITLGQVLIPPLKIMTDTLADSIGVINDTAQAFINLAQHAKDAANAIKDSFPNVNILPDLPEIAGKDPEKEGRNIGKKVAIGIKDSVKNTISGAVKGFTLGPLSPVLDVAQFVDSFRESNTEAGKVALQVREILAGLKGSSEVAQGIAFTGVIGQLTKLQNKLAGSDKTGQHLASEISDIITALKEGTALPPFAFPKVELPPDLKAGAPGKAGGDAVIDAFDKALDPNKILGISTSAFKNVEAGIKAGLANIGPAIEASLDIAQNAIRAKLNSIGHQAQLQLNRLQSQALQLQVEGATPQELLANAQKQVTTAKTRLSEGVAAGLARKELDKRRQDVIDAQNLVKGFKSDIATNTEKLKQDAKKANDAADQAILDALEPSATALDTRALIAQGTKSLQDNIDVAKAQQANNLKQIAAIDASFKDRKEAAQKIAALKQQNIQLNQQIAEDTRSIFEAALQPTEAQQARLDLATSQGNIPLQIKILNQRIKDIQSFVDKNHIYGQQLVKARAAQNEIRTQIDDLNQQRLQSKLDLAQAQDNIPLQIRLLDQRIKGIDRLIEKEHIVGDRLRKLKTERASHVSDVQALRDQQLADRTALGQSIFDLTGNKSPLLKALQAEIANKNKEIAAAAKAGKSTVKLRTELNGLLKQRKDLLNEAADSAKEPTTAFDLLTEFTSKFNDIAGNLINANQPFAGASAFGNDIVQKGISNFMVPHRPIDIRLRGDDKQNQQTAATTDNTAAVRENTDALRSWFGGRSSSTVPAPKSGNSGAAIADDRAFWQARKAREVKEG